MEVIVTIVSKLVYFIFLRDVNNLLLYRDEIIINILNLQPRELPSARDRTSQ